MHTIIIPGKPIPLKRPRHFMRGGKSLTWNSQSALQQQIRTVVKAQTLLHEGPLSVHILFCLPIPKSASKVKTSTMNNSPHTHKPDIDNLIKFVLDVLNGIAFDDDRQVSEIIAHKMWSNTPRTEITITAARTTNTYPTQATP
jgi:Holliday junction resolvase RusA-like endonuclease